MCWRSFPFFSCQGWSQLLCSWLLSASDSRIESCQTVRKIPSLYNLSWLCLHVRQLIPEPGPCQESIGPQLCFSRLWLPFCIHGCFIHKLKGWGDHSVKFLLHKHRVLTLYPVLIMGVYYPGAVGERERQVDLQLVNPYTQWINNFWTQWETLYQKIR